MKTYVLINKNAEGQNFLGVFSTPYKARAAQEEHNEKLRTRLQSLGLKKTTIDNMMDWDNANLIIEATMDAAR